MGKVLRLPQGKKKAEKVCRSKDSFEAITDPVLRAACMTLYENDQRLAEAANLNLMEVLQRLENLEAIVFAQSVLIADLRGKPLTPRQRAKISQVLKRQKKRPSKC